MSLLKKPTQTGRKCRLCKLNMFAKLIRPETPEAWLVFYCEVCDLIRS